jgi:hypothetical protein
MIVEVYSPGDTFLSQGEQSIFERPDSAKDRDRYIMGVGRLLMKGSACFRSTQFEDWDITPEVGDYVIFKKYQGIQNTNIGREGKVVMTVDLKDYECLGITHAPQNCGSFNFGC